jgi:hypothetical protein
MADLLNRSSTAVDLLVLHKKRRRSVLDVFRGKEKEFQHTRDSDLFSRAHLNFQLLDWAGPRGRSLLIDVGLRAAPTAQK